MLVSEVTLAAIGEVCVCVSAWSASTLGLATLPLCMKESSMPDSSIAQRLQDLGCCTGDCNADAADMHAMSVQAVADPRN